MPFSLSPADRRQHVYVIGKTGTGKTTLLRSLILQDIAAGEGVGVLDPHGDLAEDLIDHIPPWRMSDVVYFNPADVEYPVGFNLLRAVPAPSRSLVASGIVSAFKHLWRDSWGPRLEYILYATIAALLDVENATILGVQRMLADAEYRRWVVKQIKDPAVKAFWEGEFALYDKRFMAEAIAPVQNKVGQLVMSPVIRNIVGQVKSRFDTRFIMDRKRIFIANLSKGKLGEDKSNLLGSMLVTAFQLASMSRSGVPEKERVDFRLFVDEFQNFATGSFASILSESRKYRLSLTLSHQYIDQLSPEIRSAVFGNVGTFLAFRVGEQDAKSLAQEFGDGYPVSAFTSLGNFELCGKILQAGAYAEPMRGRTEPHAGHRYGRSARVIRHCRQKYGVPLHIVEERIRRWLAH